jgi:5'-nucleotidase
MIILIDQDGPLADFETEFLRRWRTIHADRRHIAVTERRIFKLSQEYDQLSPGFRQDADQIMQTRGFFADLPLVEGAVQALQEMLDEGDDPQICTSPIMASRFCAGEKYEWVRRHLGAAWLERFNLVRDKTLVRGDVLIDDKPAVTGRLTPEWRHIIYDAPYNRSAHGARLASWSDWRACIA